MKEEGGKEGKGEERDAKFKALGSFLVVHWL